MQPTGILTRQGYIPIDPRNEQPPTFTFGMTQEPYPHVDHHRMDNIERELEFVARNAKEGLKDVRKEHWAMEQRIEHVNDNVRKLYTFINNAVIPTLNKRKNDQLTLEQNQRKLQDQIERIMNMVAPNTVEIQLSGPQGQTHKFDSFDDFFRFVESELQKPENVKAGPSTPENPPAPANTPISAEIAIVDCTESCQCGLEKECLVATN